MNIEEWRKVEKWRKAGKNFSIEVSHHEADAGPTPFRSEGTHRWCVYAYIYPDHPHFKKFEGDTMYQDAACVLPLHGGPSFLEYHRHKDGKVTSIQVGADYNHLHDEFYTFLDKPSLDVFDDADKLFAWLSQENESVATIDEDAKNG